MAIKIDPASIVKEFNLDKTYKTSKGFFATWKECVDFNEGRHWENVPVSKETRMPRVTTNQINFITRNKKSNILSQNLKMVYSPGELPEDGNSEPLMKAAEDYTDAAAQTWSDIDQDGLIESLVNNTIVEGTGILHYLLDNEYSGGQFTAYIGTLKGESINLKDICFGNPRLSAYQVQDQSFITIRKASDADTLKERAKKTGTGWETIQPDEPKKGTELENEVTENSNVATSYIKYYRKNKQMWWVEVTETATIQKSIALAPSIEGMEVEPATLYPIVILVLDEIKDCTFGRSSIQDVIPINKAINWVYSMILNSVQGNAWAKVLVKVGALLQPITNTPGEIITDHSMMQGADGIKYMQPPNFSNMPPLLAEKLIELSRQTTSTTEINSGEALGANMAAAAIMALQSQAQKPYASDKNKVYRMVKCIGRIYEQFYKSNYNMPRPIQGKNLEGEDITKKFTGSDSAKINFDLVIDVGPANEYSEALQLTVVQNMYDKKDITKYQFVKYSPKNIVPQELKQDFEKEEKLMQEQQAQAAQMQQHAGNIMGQLNPQEQAVLQQNPQMINQVVNSIQQPQTL
jgi:hypothetical protein